MDVGQQKSRSNPGWHQASLAAPVDRDPEFGNISRYAGIGHNLEMDR